MPDYRVDVQVSSPVNCVFTSQGEQQFKRTIIDYSTELFQRAKSDADKGNNLGIEINAEHVISAAYHKASSFGLPKKPTWLMPVQVGEYVGVAVAGVGAGHLDNRYGILSFGIGLSLAVVLVVIRFSKSKED